MHLQKILRQINLHTMVKLYETGVRALVITKGSRKKGKIIYVKSRPGPQSSNKMENQKMPFWEASKHAEFVVLDRLLDYTCPGCHPIVILFRILPAHHPNAQIPLSDEWSLGSADMCKTCIEMLQKAQRSRLSTIGNISWLTPDSNSENQLRPAVPTNPVPTASYMRYQRYQTYKASQ